jgi:hypothetical protein
VSKNRRDRRFSGWPCILTAPVNEQNYQFVILRSFSGNVGLLDLTATTTIYSKQERRGKMRIGERLHIKSSGSRGGRIGLWVCMIMVLLVTFTGTGFSEDNNFEFASRHQFCTKTSHAALRACRNEVRDDFWIGVGICNNLSDPGERIECLVDAGEARQEQMGECSDQLEARLDVCEEIGEAPYDPEAIPANFVNPLEIGSSVAPNPYLPLIPGTVWIYEGGGETITVTVTEEIKEILGVPCIVVRDVVEEDDEIIEDTDDWYAQDTQGNVWYFGEIAQNFEDGELVDVEGSWKAGRDGDKQGVLMKLNPEIGDVYRQEFSLGNAEDMGRVVAMDEQVTVPAGTYQTLVTEDYTPIEPDVLENKHYAPGVGLVLEVDVETGDRVELVEIKTP